MSLDEYEHLLEPHELAEAGPSESVLIPIELIDPSPNNPRKVMPEIEALAASIKDFTLLQPVVLRRTGDRYELLSGHRRRLAYLLLAEQEPAEPRWRAISATIRTLNDERAYLALITSQVHSLNWQPREQAAALESLAKDHTLKQIGDIFHKGESWASKRLRIYADAVLSGYVQTGRLLAGVAEEFLIVRDPVVRRGLAEQAALDKWTQPKARAEVRKLRLSAQLADLDRRVQDMLRVLSTVQPGTIPIETFRNLLVLRGRIDVLGQLARGGSPRFPSVEQAQKAAGVKTQDRPTRKRRAGYRPKL